MPEPMLVSIAASLATRAVAGLYELVRAKFADDPVATAALTAAEGAAEDSPQVAALSETLERAIQADPAFGAELRAHHAVTQTGRVNNQISGTVHGTVVQAGDVTGGINLK
ncbi:MULTISPECIES: hypothetical protein [Saccharothrix]|uniref:hypothetical protein n=1 Tax=Saccharothrix TaxID=2071 RepID=UPI00093E41F8|nr:hypothetical protein [Saccharothrix sp. CB00851]OKI33191.1 hypothetical protein A6A25_05165 [Saccharothrix sp. CB00851]